MTQQQHYDLLRQILPTTAHPAGAYALGFSTVALSNGAAVTEGDMRELAACTSFAQAVATARDFYGGQFLAAPPPSRVQRMGMAP